MQLDEHAVVALRGEVRDAARAIDDPQADHTFIIRDRAIEVGDLQTNAADVRRVGESIARRPNAVRSGCLFSRCRHASPSETFSARLAPIRRLHRGVGAPPRDERIDRIFAGAGQPERYAAANNERTNSTPAGTKNPCFA